MKQREIQLQGGRFVVRTDLHAGFWDSFASGSWEPMTLEILQQHLAPGNQFIDIGSWIGPLALFAAALGSRVLAFEPDPVARQELEENVALNPTLAPMITIDPRAAASRNCVLYMSGGEAGLGESVSRVTAANDSRARVAAVHAVDIQTLVRMDEFINCALLKVDIEGGEYTLIPRLRDYLGTARVPLLVSLHGYDLRERRARLPKRIHTLWLRVVQGARRHRLFRALSSYPYVYWTPHATTKGTSEWALLTLFEKIKLAARLSEAELYCRHVSIEEGGSRSDVDHR